MLTWSHYQFRMRLTEKAKDNPGCQVVVVDEAYTSKTCGWMFVEIFIGSWVDKKLFHCSNLNCGV